MRFFDILNSLLHEYGRFHICFLLILFFSQIRIHNNFISYSLTAREPIIRCLSPDEIDILISYRTDTNYTNADLKERNLPLFFYILQNASAPNQCPRVYSNGSDSCEDWVYDVSISGFTLPVEFDLCFDNLHRLYHLQVVVLLSYALGWYIGMLIGSLIGRRKALLIGLTTDTLYSVITPFTGDLVAYMIMKFFSILGSSCMMAMLSVYIIEILPKSQRSIFNFLSLCFFSFAFIPLAILGELSRNWFHLEAASCFINCIITGLILFLLPESPKWLFLERKNYQARYSLTWIYRLHSNVKVNTQDYDGIPVEIVKEKRWDAFDHLFSTIPLSRKTLVLLIFQSIHLACYLFFTLNTTLLAGKPALSFVAFTICDLSVSIIIYVFRNSFAQKSLMLALTIISTIFLIILSFVVAFAVNQGGVVSNFIIYIIRLCSWIGLQVLPRYGGLIYQSDTLHIRRAFFELMPRFYIVIGALILIAAFPIKFCYILTAVMLINCISMGFLPNVKPPAPTENEIDKSLTMR